MTMLFKCNICGEIEEARETAGVLYLPEGWEVITYRNPSKNGGRIGHICPDCQEMEVEE